MNTNKIAITQFISSMYLSEHSTLTTVRGTKAKK